jgi:hypothetical protein
MGILWQYSTSPGVPANAPASWPARSRIPHPADSPTLVMIIHPRCPCSRASIGELSALMARAARPLHPWVVFVRPHGFSESWAKTDLWRSAAAIPGVTTVLDDGREAALFGAATSGQTVVYDGNGRLLFSGGITGARGHWGDNAGLSAVVAMMNRPASGVPSKAAVYGCPLFAKSSGRSSTCQK